MMFAAKKNKLNSTNSNLPNVSDVITDWFLKVTFKWIRRTLVGSDWVRGKETLINTLGVVQPPSDEDLKILPEGTWAWQWLMLHCLPDVILQPNDFIIYDDIQYTVMAKKDYTKYGYVQYTLLESFKAGTLNG